MSQQDNLRNILQQLAALDTSNHNPVPVEKDSLAEVLAAEYRAFLGELGPVSSTSSTAQPAAAPLTSNTATSGSTTTTDDAQKAQQDLEQTIKQLGPKLGPGVDPKKTAQALSAAAAGQQTPGDGTKDLAPVIGKMLTDPTVSGQFKALLNKLK